MRIPRRTLAVIIAKVEEGAFKPGGRPI